MSNININNGVLILSFPEAETPVVWRMNMEEAALAAFEVQKSGKSFALRLKTSDGKNEDIVLFKTKDEAVKALMDVTQAMQTMPASTGAAQAVSGQAAPVIMQPVQAKPKKWGWGLLKTVFLSVLFSFLLIVVLLFILMKSGPSYNRFPKQEGAGQNTVGAPQSADDFFNQRQ